MTLLDIEAFSAIPQPVILFGGTFDPIQTAHCEVVKRAVANPYYAKGSVVFIPTRKNPLKKDGPVATDEDRLAMISLAISVELSGLSCFVSDLECRRTGPDSYTVDTVKEVRKRLGMSAPIYLLSGSDSATSFFSWRDYEEILQGVNGMIVALRNDSDRENLSTMKKSLPSSLSTKFASELLEGEVLSVSASEVRRKIKAREDVSTLVPISVWKYLESKRLYRDSPSALE